MAAVSQRCSMYGRNGFLVLVGNHKLKSCARQAKLKVQVKLK